MIDVEKIADSISPKREVIKIIPDDYPEKFERKKLLFADKPLPKEIFQARDIKDLEARKKHLQGVLEKEKNYDIVPQYAGPLVKRVISNGKIILDLEAEIAKNPGIYGYEADGTKRITPDKLLIEQCEAELLVVEDLLKIKEFAEGYAAISGENERKYFLLMHHAIAPQYKIDLHSHYSNDAYAKIIQAIVEAIGVGPGILPTATQANGLNSIITAHLGGLRDAFNSEQDYLMAAGAVEAFFVKGKVDLRVPLFIKSGNIKLLAFAMGEIWRSQKNEVINAEYLQLYKHLFSIFKKHEINMRNIFGCLLYKYSISKT